MSIQVKLCTDAQEWDNLAHKCASSSLFHRWDFLKIMEKHTRKRLFGKQYKGILQPLIAYNGNEPIGAFPIYYYRHPLVSTILSPPSKTETIYLGPVLVNYEDMKRCKMESILIEFQKLVDEYITKNLKPQIAIFHLPPEIYDSRPFKWEGYSVEPRHTYTLNLSVGAEHIWDGFHTSLRNKIKKSKNDGITVRDGTQADLEFIYKTLEERYKEQGLIMEHSLDYLEDVHRRFEENIQILIAEKYGKRIGGIINIRYKERVTSWIGGHKINGTNSNELLLWETIESACEGGYKIYENTGGDTPKLYQTKKKYGMDLTTYLSCKKYSGCHLKIMEVIYSEIKKRKQIRGAR